MCRGDSTAFALHIAVDDSIPSEHQGSVQSAAAVDAGTPACPYNNTYCIVSRILDERIHQRAEIGGSVDDPRSAVG